MTHDTILSAAVAAVRSVNEMHGGWTRRSQARSTMTLRLEIEGKSYEVTAEVQNDSRSYQTADIDIPEAVTRLRPPVNLLEDTFCRSPIAGRIVAVFAASGQTVRKNEPVVVIEAMKMEIQIPAAVDGVLESVHVKPGEAVHTGQLLFQLT
jgi:biotin carboxyl carrier protein